MVSWMNWCDTFNQELRHIYDELAPEKECRVHLRPKQPWYDEEMKHQKRKVHVSMKRSGLSISWIHSGPATER